MDLYISIDNSSDGLPQEEWSEYWSDVNDVVLEFADVDAVYGVWTSEANSKFQNACWAVGVPEENLSDFGNDLNELRRRFHQDMITVSAATTLHLSSANSELDFNYLSSYETEDLLAEVSKRKDAEETA